MKLRPYQQDGVTFAFERDYAMLLCPMGAGKTAIAFTALKELFDADVITRALVVGPKRVIETVWEAERDAWPHLHGVTVATALGTPKQRRAAIESGAQVTLVNYENLEWALLEFKECPFDALVMDETSKLKSTGSYRFRELRRNISAFKYRLGMTATPVSEGLMDFYAQARCIDDGTALGRSVTPFRNKYFTNEGYEFPDWQPRPGAEEEIINLVKPFCFTVDPADYADQLPPLIENIIKVPIPTGKAARCYKDMQETWVYEGIEAVNAGAHVNKLRQIASGFLYYEDFEENENHHPYLTIHKARVKALAELVAERQGEPVMVAYNYQAELEMLMGAVPGEKLSTDAIARWNRREIPVLYLHPKSGGHGLNLQKGGCTIIWYSLPWSRDEFEQTVGRILRSGQEAPQVWSHILQAPNTVDPLVLAALRAKGNVQKRVLEALK